jgi:hypothetical protein
MNGFRDRLLAAALTLAALSLIACDVDVHEKGKDKNVDVHTAFGDISVRTSEGGPDTGLPVYPGAQPLRDEDEEPENADIKVASSHFGMHVAAAKFESKDAPQAIVDFYKDKLGSYGAVIECKGEIDFEGEPGQPVCREKPDSSEIQLVAGASEENHRMVAVKPRGSGSEFAVVHIQIDKRS